MKLKLLLLSAACISLSSCSSMLPSMGTAKECQMQAVTQMDEGRYQDAIAQLSHAIELGPQDYQSFDLRGLAYLGTKDFVNAQKDLETAARLNPRSSDVYAHMAELKLASGDNLACVTFANQALEKDPHNSTAYSLRALVRAKQNNLYCANQDAAMSVQFCGSNPKSCLKAALTCIAVNDVSSAISCFRKAGDQFRASGNEAAYQLCLAQIEALSRQEKSNQIMQSAYTQANASSQALRGKREADENRIMDEFKSEVRRLQEQMKSLSRRDSEGYRRIQDEIQSKSREYQDKLRKCREEASMASRKEQEKEADVLQEAQRQQMLSDQKAHEESKGPLALRVLGGARGIHEIMQAILYCMGFSVIVFLATALFKRK